MAIARVLGVDVAEIAFTEDERRVWQSEQPQWISVKDKLPENDEDVLVFAKGKNSGANRVVITYIADSFYFGGTQIKYSDGPQWNSPWQYFLEDYEITHWMPLPEPPKGEES
jgi:hypothetical protein